MSAARKLSVMGGAVLLVALALWQVIEARDDWPLSNFNLYSFIAGRTATRYVVAGFGPEGETELKRWQIRLAASPKFALERLRRDPRRMKRFIKQVRTEYERTNEQRARDGKDRLPELAGIRIIRERWRLKSNMKGADRPKRKLLQTLYIPPAPLTERIKQEASGKAAVLEAKPVPASDLVLEAEQGALDGAARVVSDKYAYESSSNPQAGAAVLLKSRKKSPGKVTLSFETDRSEVWLLMRLRTNSRKAPGIVTLKLDGKTPRALKKGAGNFGRYYRKGWVWTSRSLAHPPVKLKLKKKKGKRATSKHRLTIAAKRGDVVVDQVWLSTKPRELPLDNRPVVPGGIVSEGT